MRETTYLCLVHHPTVDRNGKIVTTAITSLDLHDFARLARTYGLGGVFAQTNQKSQVELAGRLLGHWVEGWGGSYNPNRKEALEGLSLVSSVEAAVEEVERRTGLKPIVAATSARHDGPPRMSFAEARTVFSGEKPGLVLFGTGWGLYEAVFGLCDLVIEPIGSPEVYNHLSVRSAASIVVDRLFGQF